MEFKQLNTDILPINPLIDTNSLDYKNQLNLIFNSSQALSNIQNYLSLLSQKIDNSPNTVKTLNYVLESYLYILLTTSTISNLDNTSLSNFYSRKKKVDSDYFQTINNTYLENLSYTNYRVWGSNFGSLGYYLYLNNSYIHYANPSYLVRTSIESLLNSLSLDTYINSLLTVINSDKQEDDYELYKHSIHFVKEIGLIKVVTYLERYEEYLSELILWYSETITSDLQNIYQVGSNAYRAFNLLVQLGQVLVKLGLFLDSFKNLPYKFIHQEIELDVLEGIDNLIEIINANRFKITSDLTREEVLVNKLFSINNKELDSIRKETYNLLSINSVGGLNTWLTLIAAELINRAYILTFNQYSNSSLIPLTEGEDLQKFIERVYRLVFYAGYCLKKTNLNHLQLIGFNLRILSQLEDDTSLREFNLLE